MMGMDCINQQARRDLISRQAAIDVARKCSVKEVTPAYMLIDKAEVMTELMMLPSAHPTQLNTPNTLEALDCISRKDAIAEIARWIGYLDKDMISRIQIGLERLPSAQPEIEERMSETEQNVPNDDFISRKRAIDAIMEEFKRIPTNAIRAKTVIEQLPPAKPEIIRCKDCKYADPFGHCDYVNFWNAINDFCSRAERKENR